MSLENSQADIRELAYTWPLCFEFRLPADSVVVVAGSYKGKVVELLLDLYPEIKMIHGFEPQEWARNACVERLQGRDKWVVHPHAIGISDAETLEMGEWGTDACSFVNVGPGSREHGFGAMKEFHAEMTNLGIERIDLAVFNMEGYEFLLLPHLIKWGWHKRIGRMAVQWHVDLGAGGYRDIDKQVQDWQNLQHRLVYDHRPQWTYTENYEAWK